MSDALPKPPTRREVARALASCGAAAALVGLPGCHWLEQPLSVAAHVWVGYEPMFLAENRAWLDTGRVNLLQTKNSQDTVTALAQGRAQAGALTLDEVLRARAGGLPLSIVLIFNISLGADMLLVRPGIQTLAQLKGLRLGFDAGSVGEIMLAEALHLGGLTPADLQLTQLPVERQLLAWQSRSLDAIISYEPMASRLMGLGMQRLFDSRQIPNTIIDVLAVHRDALNWRHGAPLRHLIEAHFRALTEFERNPQDAAYRMASHLNLSPSDVLSAFKGLLLPNVAHNHQMLAGPTLLRERAQQLSGVLLRAGLLQHNDNLAGLLDADYLPVRGLA